MTFLDLVKRSMRLLGALAPGDQPTADEQQDGLTALNAMVDAWGTRSLMIYASARNVYTLTPGQQVYEIGPNATGTNWAAPRPTKIDYAGVLLPSNDPTQTVEEPLGIIQTDGEFAAIKVKALQSTLPLKLYYDTWFSNPNPPSQSTPADVGSANVFLWPCPTVAYQIALYTPSVISRLTSLTQLVSLPLGYERALAYNLAIEMAPEFEREPSQVVIAIATESLADLERANYRPRKLRADRSLDRTRSGGGWDYRTGDRG